MKLPQSVCVWLLVFALVQPPVLAQPILQLPDAVRPQTAASTFSNLRVVRQSNDGTEVTLAMNYAYDGLAGVSATILPVIEKRGKSGTGSWFGADPQHISQGRGLISVTVKYFNDEPGVPPQFTSDRVRLLLLDYTGRMMLSSALFLKTINWGSPNAKPVPLPTGHIGGLPSNQLAENSAAQAAQAKAREAQRLKAEAEAKRLADEQRLAQEKAAVEARKREEARLKAEAEAKRLAEETRLAQEKAKAEALEREQARLKAEAELKARQEAEAKALAEAQAREEARLAALAQEREAARAQAELEAKRLAEEKRKADEKALAEAQAREQARLKAEAELKARQEAEAKARAEAEAREKARLAAEAEAKRLAEERRQAEEKARAEAEAQEKARLAAEAEARRQAELKAEAEAKRLAEEKRLAEAKAKAEAQAREKARLQAEAQEKARREAEAKAKVEAEARELARQKAEAEAKRLEEEKRLAEAQAKAEAEAREKARLAAEQKARDEALARAAAEEKARAEAEAKAKAEIAARETARRRAEAEATRLAEEKRLADEKAKQEAAARETARLRAEAEAKRLAEEARLAAERAKTAAPTLAVAEDQSFLPNTSLKTRVTNVDVVNRSVDRTKMTIGVEFEYRDKLDKPMLGVNLSRTGEAGVSSLFDVKPADIGRSRRNFVLFPVTFNPPANQLNAYNTFSTDRLLVYLESVGGQRFKLFTAAMLLIWRAPGATLADSARSSTGNLLELDDLKQNDASSGYVTVRYQLTGGPGKLRMRLFDTANPASAGYVNAEEVKIQPGRNLQLLEFSVKSSAPIPTDQFKVNTLEVEMLDAGNNVLTRFSRQVPMTLSKPQ